jgi:urate oxidase
MKEEYLASVKARYEQNQKSLETIKRATAALDRAVSEFNFDSAVIDSDLITCFKDAENSVNFAVIDLKEDLEETEN